MSVWLAEGDFSSRSRAKRYDKLKAQVISRQIGRSISAERAKFEAAKHVGVPLSKGYNEFKNEERREDWRGHRWANGQRTRANGPRELDKRKKASTLTVQRVIKCPSECPRFCLKSAVCGEKQEFLLHSKKCKVVHMSSFVTGDERNGQYCRRSGHSRRSCGKQGSIRQVYRCIGRRRNGVRCRRKRFCSGNAGDGFASPVNAVEEVHAVVLSGGSAFGLQAATGAMDYLEEQGKGLETGYAHVPIVPSAILYDLSVGDASVRPDREMGYRACQAADVHVPVGNVGAGCGATVGKALGMDRAMKAGLGTASVRLPDGLIVGAIVAVNAYGHVVDPATGKILAGPRGEDGTILDLPVNAPQWEGTKRFSRHEYDHRRRRHECEAVENAGNEGCPNGTRRPRQNDIPCPYDVGRRHVVRFSGGRDPSFCRFSGGPRSECGGRGYRSRCYVGHGVKGLPAAGDL